MIVLMNKLLPKIFFNDYNNKIVKKIQSLIYIITINIMEMKMVKINQDMLKINMKKFIKKIKLFIMMIELTYIKIFKLIMVKILII